MERIQAFEHLVASKELALELIEQVVAVGIAAGDHTLVHLDHLFVHQSAAFVATTIEEEHLDLGRQGSELA